MGDISNGYKTGQALSPVEIMREVALEIGVPENTFKQNNVQEDGLYLPVLNNAA
ncbi:hypothetical protein AtNW77_Chr4g0277491 [Arabidopsis thaliana]